MSSPHLIQMCPFSHHIQRLFDTIRETLSVQAHTMTGQTPLNKEADDKQQQRGSSTSTGNTALTSEDDLTLHELSNTVP
jgi:hypothetical protein